MGDHSTRSSVRALETRPIQKVGMENPFALKVLQVFTGFGIGCGIGIGVGQPINLGAVPMVGQVMSAASGATYAVSGISRHVNDALRKVGAKNVRAGIGCGVGFGHGFGLVGFSMRPSVIQKIQTTLFILANKMLSKIGTPTSPAGQVNYPSLSSSEVSILDKSSIQNPLNGFSQFPHSQSLVANSTTTSDLHNPQFGSQTEKVLTSFMQNPILKEGSNDASLLPQVNHLRTENSMMQMVLKHQLVIAQLMEENEKLRRILIEDLNIPPSKVESNYTTSTKPSMPCSDCLECRRKQRRR